MNSLPVFLSFSFSYLSFLMRNPQCGLVNHIGDFSDVNSKEPLNKSSAAERRIFYTNRAVRKMENTYSIPSFFVLSLGAKSLAVSSCRFNQSFPTLAVYLDRYLLMRYDVFVPDTNTGKEKVAYTNSYLKDLISGAGILAQDKAKGAQPYCMYGK